MQAHSKIQPRILFIDENVRDIGGHYLELASLLAEGAGRLGYQSCLAAHRDLAAQGSKALSDSRIQGLNLVPEFSVRRLEHWTLGVDGRSNVMRSEHGDPIGSSIYSRVMQRCRDASSRSSRRPKRMLHNWADAFVRTVEAFRPKPIDRIVINTGSDFQMLALASAMERLDQDTSLAPLTIHVVFHFAVFDGSVDRRAIRFGDQVNKTISRMARHQVHLHATTEALRDQLDRVGIRVSAIPYPTRKPFPRNSIPIKSNPTRIVLAGIPRAEKGRDKIKGLLQLIEQSHLRPGKIRWSMQVRGDHSRRVIPSSMSDLAQSSGEGTDSGPLELLYGNQSSECYHRWLDSADVGLFLYEPQRYVARCSGVLLEMMIRGVPVIVPEGSWLADQVRLAESNGPIGWIYERVSQIPSILDQLPDQLSTVTANCNRYAEVVADRHSGMNSLLQMGIQAVGGSIQRAVG